MFSFDPKSLARLQHRLEKEFPRETAREGHKVLAKAARELRNKIRAAAPVDTGELRRSIYVKRLRDKFSEPMATDVRVTRGGKTRAKIKRADAYYWRFIEYGTKAMSARPFVGPTVEKFKPRLAELFKEYTDVITEKFNKP